MSERARKALWRKGEIAPHARPFSQKLNPNSLFRATALSRLAGMERAHVSLVRLPPGKDSFANHAHMLEEEWLYIISGRAIAEIDGQSYEVGAGDFMGFATPSVPHLLRNTFDQECVYLMGGEDKPIDVVTYPDLGKRFLLMQTEKGTEFYELGEPQKPFGKADG
ncbi:MAG TPA: cupin domain-containing protein [Caulobacterales bacterium]|nr:cupin domain-containing protein [Caulobacterales bacterium]